jgi:hypothetical protein
MATITEDYCSKEIYRLLIEKGFDGEIHTTFDEEGYTQPSITLQMAMKWLREVYKIHIQIWILEEKGYWFNIEKILNAQYKHKSLYSSGLEDIYFETYEQAAESAIKYWLKNKEYI